MSAGLQAAHQLHQLLTREWKQVKVPEQVSARRVSGVMDQEKAILMHQKQAAVKVQQHLALVLSGLPAALGQAATLC